MIVQKSIEVVLPLPIDKTFSYAVTKEEFNNIIGGSRVVVSFGKKKFYSAVVIDKFSERKYDYELKEIEYIIDDKPCVNDYQIKFFKWIADYYMCPLGKVFETALPKLFLIKSETIIEILSQEVGEDLSEKAKNLFYHLSGFDEISLNDIIKLCGKDSIKLINELAINWYRNKFNNTLESIDGNFENYRISDVLMSSYKLIWDDFCSWLLEILKPEYGQKIDQKSKSELIELFIKNLKIIHPFMPFLSEEIYHNLNDKVSQPITISSWPSKEEYDMQLINSFEITKEIISQIRNYRKEKNIPFKTSIKLYYIPTNKSIDNIDVIKKIGFIEDIIESVKSDFGLVKSFIIKNYEFFIPLDEGFDKDSEIKKLNKELEYNIGFLKSVDSKLKNKNFISNAPKEIIDKEKQKIIDTEQKIKSIKKSISELS